MICRLIAPGVTFNAAAAWQNFSSRPAASKALMALRGLGVVDARARGLVVQAAWPKYEAA